MTRSSSRVSSVEAIWDSSASSPETTSFSSKLRIGFFVLSNEFCVSEDLHELLQRILGKRCFGRDKREREREVSNFYFIFIFGVK